MSEYDIIVIGSGIAGLYSAFLIKQMSPKTSILILEQNNTIGGRMGSYNFYNNYINTGAGIGRKKKDINLINLLNQLNIKYNEFMFYVKYSKYINPDINISQIIKLLKQKYSNDFSSYTFKKYAIYHLGIKLYKDFITKIGFSDFEKEAVNDVLNYYGLDDNTEGWIALKIDWNMLIEKISEKIGLINIKVKNKVISISKINDKFIVNTIKQKYYSNKIIIATTIDTIFKILPTLSIYKQVHGQPFLRVYAKFSNPIPNLEFYTIVTGPLKKISPINIKDAIYMIAYTDNKSAILLQNYTTNNLSNRQYFCKLVEKALDVKNLNLIAIKSFYWEIGTHYYEPLKKTFKNRTQFINQAQHPDKNILVVGEMISKHQGWTMGTLDSVETVVKLDWISK